MNSTQVYRTLLVFLLLLFTLTISSSPAAAQAAPTKTYRFTVNTTNDTHDAHLGDGQCADKNGQCSLRAAIEESDALPLGSNIKITVPQGTYALKLGTLVLTDQRGITIHGAGETTTIIKGKGTSGILRISGQASTALSQLTISGGRTRYGGGIFNSGMLTVSDSTISGNIASSNSNGRGGGIYNRGTLTLSNSTISGNKANGIAGSAGGGIYNETNATLTVSDSTITGNKAAQHGGGISNGDYNTNGGTVSVSNSTISNNSGYYDSGGFYNNGRLSVSNSTINNNTASDYGGDGGGIYNDHGGTVSVSKSTISNNLAYGGDGGALGGGIFNYGITNVKNSTLSTNTAGVFGGGIYNDGGVSLSNSTLSGNWSGEGEGAAIYIDFGSVSATGTILANSKVGLNCYGTVKEMAGYNLDSDGSCGFMLSTDINNKDPMLGPLQNNGGPTQTMALLQGSPAIDWVALSSCPGKDQRGYTRPDNNESACDIGAYESAY